MVESLLGQGANGKVYLVRKGTGLFAMKIGFDPLDLQSEINVLQALQLSNRSLQRFLIEVDDYYEGSQAFPFYIMRYVRGHTISVFLHRQGLDWLHVLGRSLLEKLAGLHRDQWVFGDMKAGNVLVSDAGQVELIDYGGLTQTGKSLKQFTELYDRGYWNAGSRTADPAYDLFSVAVLLLHLTDSAKRLDGVMLPQRRNREFLLELLEQNTALRKVRPVLKKAIKGEYKDAEEALQEWRMCTLRGGKTASSGGSLAGWLSGLFAASLLLFASVLMIVLR